MASRNGRYWSLFPYEAGTHFSGKGTELESAAEALGTLVLASLELWGPVRTDSVGAFRSQLPALVQSAVADDPKLELDPHVNAIERALTVVDASHETLPSVRVHLDFHPSNLLVRDGRVASILDLEDIVPYPLGPALGFAAFKLIRQILVGVPEADRSARGGALVTRWAAAWRNVCPQFEVGPAELAAGARFRVLALVHLILTDRLEHGRRLVGDLPKQLSSLDEIDAIFGQVAR